MLQINILSFNYDMTIKKGYFHLMMLNYNALDALITFYHHNERETQFEEFLFFLIFFLCLKFFKNWYQTPVIQGILILILLYQIFHNLIGFSQDVYKFNSTNYFFLFCTDMLAGLLLVLLVSSQLL